jgi:hypothetical protein
MTAINATNFHLNTACIWNAVVTTRAELVAAMGAANYNSNGVSEYWYTEDGVYRCSDHWGKVASCTWHLDTEAEEHGNGFRNGCYASADLWQVAFCKWEDFAAKNYAPHAYRFNDLATSFGLAV